MLPQQTQIVAPLYIPSRFIFHSPRRLERTVNYCSRCVHRPADRGWWPQNIQAIAFSINADY